MNTNLCFIKEQYFIDNPNLVKILDIGFIQKQSQRLYLCVAYTIDFNHFYIPLRKNLGDAVRVFGRIGHSVPSQNRPDAGLDYRHVLLINDEKYIEHQLTQKIPQSQMRILINDYNIIKNEFAEYLQKYKKVARKNRINKEPLFRDSSLINFHSFLFNNNTNST